MMINAPVQGQDFLQDTPKDLANVIRRSLFNNKDLYTKNVTVQVIDRKVYLEGTVRLADQKMAIDKFVESFPFIETVSSYITIRKNG